MEQTPYEKIQQRRRQMIIHSIIYYRYCTSIISDAEFDKWAKELVQLQRDYPQEAQEAQHAALFADWDGTTGMHLIEVESLYSLAKWLLDNHRDMKKGAL